VEAVAVVGMMIVVVIVVIVAMVVHPLANNHWQFDRWIEIL
jgi:Tfp pilus assembly protein FimT